MRKQPLPHLLLTTFGLFLCFVLISAGVWWWEQRPSPPPQPDYDPARVAFTAPLSGRYGPPPNEQPLTTLYHALDAPRLDLPQISVNLGDVAIGAVVEHTFVVRNSGTGPLRITDLYTTCACLEASLSASVIPPDYVALLRVRLDTSKDVGVCHGASGVRRGVYMTTTDQTWPQAAVWVEAHTVPAL